jgi:hypothetical protein
MQTKKRAFLLILTDEDRARLKRLARKDARSESAILRFLIKQADQDHVQSDQSAADRPAA